MLHHLRCILLQVIWIGVCNTYIMGNLWSQKKSEIDKLILQGITYLNPTPKTLHYFITHINDSIWRTILTPIGFTEIPWQYKIVALQYEKGVPGKLYQIVSYDHTYGIISVFWQDPAKQISLIEPLKKKIKTAPILKSIYATYELILDGNTYWYSIRSQVKNGVLEEEATLEFAR